MANSDAVGSRSGAVTTWIAAAAFGVAAVWHGTGYTAIVAMAAEVPSFLGPVAPALWLTFTVDMLVVGLIVALVAWRPPSIGPAILLLAGCVPLSAAVLQMVFIGFVPPTLLLLAVAALSFLAAVLQRRSAAR